MSPLWLAVAAAAFGGFVFLHWPITAWLDDLVPRLGFVNYQRLAGAAFFVAAAGTAVAFGRRRNGTTTLTWTFLLALFGLVAVAQPTLVLINIENIHFPQYALLAVLLGRAGLAAEHAWLGATGLGVLDEAYQFLFLRAGRPDRLDWNDITFNAIGAAFGIVVLLHYDLVPARPSRRSSATLASLLAPLVLVALVVAPPVLSPFYSVTPAGLTSHELTAGEGLLLVCLLWVAARELVHRVGRRATVAAAAVPAGSVR